MSKNTFQQQVNDISPYAQINKAFRHAYGSPAAAVLSTLVYKYTYWDQNNGLVKIKSNSDTQLYHFYISKLDISLDSGVSISSLEKDTKHNPINILEDLKLIKKLSSKKARESDRFVLYPGRIINLIKKTSKHLKQDMEMYKKLSKSYGREFYKALRGKRTREEVYAEYKLEIDDYEFSLDDLEDNSDNSASLETINSSSEGTNKKVTNNITENPTENITEKTKPASFKQTVKSSRKQQTTSEELKEGIKLYNLGEKDAQQLFNLLAMYIPERAGFNWSMSLEDKVYIKRNLGGVEPETMTATIDYINTNIKRMKDGTRDMRFGSLLAGISERIIEGGVGVEDIDPPLSKSEHKKILDNMTEEQDIKFKQFL